MVDYRFVAKRFRRMAGRAKRALVGAKPVASPTEAISRLLDGKRATIVKIGSHDGVTDEPFRDLILSNPQWFVLFIEPVNSIFARLRRNYSDRRNCAFENVAIADEPSVRSFYYLSETIKRTNPDVVSWYDQLGSFDRNHILKHDNSFEPFIVSDEVRCDTLSNVLAKYRLTGKPDFIHIDAEGCDYEILKQIDLASKSLRAVLYEHVHLRASDQAEAEHFLKASGFAVRQLGFDTLAIKPR